MNKTCRIRNSQIVSCNNPNEKNPIGCLREPGWCEPTEIHHCSTAVCVNVISVNWPLIKGSLAQKCFTELTLKRTGLCCLDPLCVRSFPSCFCTSFFFGWTIYTEWMILLSNYNTRHYRCQSAVRSTAITVSLAPFTSVVSQSSVVSIPCPC